MITLSHKTLEKAFGHKVIKNYSCTGIDTATRTGWCRATSNGSNVELDYGFIELKVKDVYIRYNLMLDTFPSICKGMKKVVIEDTFFKRNIKAFRYLSRIGGIAYASARKAGVDNVVFIGPMQARCALHLKGNVCKEEVHEYIKALLPELKVTDPDVVDAIVLALNGVLEIKSI